MSEPAFQVASCKMASKSGLEMAACQWAMAKDLPAIESIKSKIK
jgi:hypothetical protein